MTDFLEVLKKRRMTRSFDGRPIPLGLLDDLVELANRAPSAGKTQGWHVIALEGEQTSRYWDATLPAERRPDFKWQGLLRAPVILVALADATAYTDRYSEPDKASTGLGVGPEAWPAPYWTIDASMAMMALLLAAENAGLGALFFGVFEGESALRDVLAIPERLDLIGTIALGYASSDDDERGRSALRPNRSADSIIHRGSW